MSKTTKTGNLSTEFRQAAALDPKGALAAMFMAAFGVSLFDCQAAVMMMVADTDYDAMMLCVTAAMQIRANVVFVGIEYAQVRTKYPVLIVEGTREVKDMFNFSACRICGHILAEVSSSKRASLMLKQAGSCIFAGTYPDTEAGKINSETQKSFAAEDVAVMQSWIEGLAADQQDVVDKFFVAIPSIRKAFEEKWKKNNAISAPAPSGKTKTTAATDAAAAAAVKTAAQEEEIKSGGKT